MSSKPYFDQVSARWDAMRSAFFSDRLRQKAIAIAHVRPGQVAADIGAGTGFITEGLVARGVRVIAVDQSLAMLAEMRKKLGAAAPVDYRQGIADALPILNASVDYAFANMYLHHTEDPARAILEMARILRRGGRLVLTDLDEHAFKFLATEQHDRWLGFKRDDVRGWLEAAGLRKVAVDCAGERCCSGSESVPEVASVSIFVAYGEK